MAKASVQGLLRTLDWQKITPESAHKVLRLIQNCHSEAMGFHAYQCEDKKCDHLHIQYHSCRNRHCPHCGSFRAQEWMEDRLRELLPVKYFHVVFTLPQELKKLVYLNRKLLYNLLFESSSHCILTLSKDPKHLGATPSISSVLHTWGQNLEFHPHVHCIVSGGGVDKNNEWYALKKGKGTYLFPYKMMEPLYKGFFLEKLNDLINKKLIKLPKGTNWKSLKNQLYDKNWIVYAKNPMGNAAQVVEYLGRYTQKIAISNHRILKIDVQGNITFSYKDYRDGGRKKCMTLSGEEFVRRFTQHILPPRYVRIRHYGFLGNYKRKERLQEIVKKMKIPPHAPKLDLPVSVKNLLMSGCSERKCPKCKKGNLVLISVVQPPKRAGPLWNKVSADNDVV